MITTLRVADLEIENTQGRVVIESGSSIDIAIRVAGEGKQVIVAEDIDSDEPIADLVNGDSKLDGKRIIDWLKDDSPRPKRKACLLNILAKLRATQAGNQTLISFLQEIFFADVDRIYARVDGELLIRLQELDEDPTRLFSADGGPIHSTHLQLLRRIPQADQDATERYILKSFREDHQPSLQITMVIPPDDRPGRGFYADIDVDLGNPKRDLTGFVVHLGELMNEGKTDHLKVYKKLMKDPAVNGHLHYNIV